MSLINNVSTILSRHAELDDISYNPYATSSEDEISILDIDWKNIIAAPPKNSSIKTAKEMKVLYNATKSRTNKEIELLYTVDYEPLTLFYNFLEKKNLPFPKNTFDEYYNVLEQYIYALKSHFNRARPEQLAPYFNIKLEVLYTDTHDTPSYPSGHTMYGALAAHILSDKYPEYEQQFFELAKYCGLARILQGVHFPSDNEAAFKATAKLYDAIKRRLQNEENKNFPIDFQP